MSSRRGAEHPLVTAVRPLVERVGGRFVALDEAAAQDVPLEWDGEPVVAVRMPATRVAGTLEQLIEQVGAQLGGPIGSLDRSGKQRAVRMLDERGAFEIRKSVDAVAEVLGVSRFTVYNYLNRS